MNIVIFTNTFTPHVGGVARSVEAFTEAYRERGHRVLVVAPVFSNMPKNELDVIRVPAIQNFNASDFSVALPIPVGLTDKLEVFNPDIIHAQHPFLLGMTAVRASRYFQLPLVFTHHTLYEQYTHYVPGDSPLLRRFVIELASHYANLTNQVFAPSESIRELLLKRGVTTPIRVVPTGVKLAQFAQGNGRDFRRRHGIPEESFVIGHLGRLAAEKNLEFLAESVAGFIRRHREAFFLVIGTGPSEGIIRALFSQAGLADRLLIRGILPPRELSDALNAMNLFAFASRSETQGMVLTEAMAAGLPVVALDAPGVREVVKDRQNGRLLQQGGIDAFIAALEWVHDLPPERMQQQIGAARETAEGFSMPRSADKALECYESLCLASTRPSRKAEKDWERVMGRIKAEWEILSSVTRAGDEALDDKGGENDGIK